MWLSIYLMGIMKTIGLPTRTTINLYTTIYNGYMKFHDISNIMLFAKVKLVCDDSSKQLRLLHTKVIAHGIISISVSESRWVWRVG